MHKHRGQGQVNVGVRIRVRVRTQIPTHVGSTMDVGLPTTISFKKGDR